MSRAPALARCGWWSGVTFRFVCAAPSCRCVRAARMPRPEAAELTALTSATATVGDVGEQFHGHVVTPRLLDVLGRHDVPAVRLDPLVAEDAGLAPVVRRPMEPNSGRRRRPGRSIRITAPASTVAWASAAPVLGFPQVTAPPHQLGLALHAIGGHDGPALGQQEVRRIRPPPSRCRPPAHTGDVVVSEQDLHASVAASASTTTSTTAPASASATASSTMARASADVAVRLGVRRSRRSSSSRSRPMASAPGFGGHGVARVRWPARGPRRARPGARCGPCAGCRASGAESSRAV